MMKKLSVLFLLITILSFSAVNAAAMETAESSEMLYFEVGRLDQAVESPWAAWGLRSAFGENDTCYRDQLDDNGKIIYNAVDTAVDKLIASALKGNVVTGSDCDATFTAELPDGEIGNYCYGVLSAYFNDHPRETVILTGSAGIGYIGNTYTMSIELLDRNVKGRIERLDTAVDAFYASFVADGMKDAPELEQYRYIHDYLCRLCQYNDDALDVDRYGNPITLTEEEFESAHNAYGALVEGAYGSEEDKGRVVCQGYADAYLLLCQKAGLDCLYIVGEGDNSHSSNFSGRSNHAWNTIKQNGGWYAVDVTWDDGDYTFKAASYEGLATNVEIDYCTYEYFADNRYFMDIKDDGITQDHETYSQIMYDEDQVSYYLEAPTLTVGRVEAVSAWKMPFLHAKLIDGAPLSDLTFVLGYGFSGYWLSESPYVILSLAGNAVADEALSIPAGKTYEIIGSGAAAAITPAEGYSGGFFSVAEGGALSIREVSITGSGGTAIQADGTVSVSGAVTVSGNAADLVLGSSGRVIVAGALSGEILLAGEEDVFFVYPVEGYAWTAQDRAVFGVDDHSLHLSYDEREDAICLESWYYTAADMPVQVGWLQADSAAELSGSTVRLQNSTENQQTLRVFVAAYDGDGRVLQISALGGGELTLSAGETRCGLVVPTLRSDTELCRIFVLAETGGVPLAEMASWDFSAA